jgi:hypothetical protein
LKADRGREVSSNPLNLELGSFGRYEGLVVIFFQLTGNLLAALSRPFLLPQTPASDARRPTRCPGGTASTMQQTKANRLAFKKTGARERLDKGDGRDRHGASARTGFVVWTRSSRSD